MKNENSEIGQGEELIRAFVQFGSAEAHAIGLYFKAEAELENGFVDVENKKEIADQLEKIEMHREDIETYANLRRTAMLKLFEMFDGDKDYWCLCKHLGIGAMQAMETYQASDNDLELLRLAYDANKAFVKAITRFLGVEISDCAACLNDMMKGV